jgi:UDP-2,3-diacylglucosamine hydrolase
MPKLAIKNKAQPKMVAFFVSDVHLCDSMPKTTAAFLNFLLNEAPATERLYLLGDLFEYWAGDDDITSPFNKKIAVALKALSLLGVQLFWIAGNRDFLVGQDFANQIGAVLLPDPSKLNLAGTELLISHGDALCTDDTKYMDFRRMVRHEQWRAEFLQRSLLERKTIIDGMRKASIKDQQAKSMAIMDVNVLAVNALFVESKVNVLVHGHTHRTKVHLEEKSARYVLPDWDCDHVSQQRGGYLSLDSDGNFEFHYLEVRTAS